MRSTHRAAVESLYDRVFEVYEAQEVEMPNGSTEIEFVKTAEARPCRISYFRVSAAKQEELTASVSQSVVMYCAPDVQVKEGSEIVVIKGTFRERYCASGTPSSYDSHKEIPLKLSGRRV